MVTTEVGHIINGSGEFISVRGAFPGVDDAVRDVVKIHWKPMISEGDEKDTRVVAGFMSKHVMLDIGGLDTESSFNVEQLRVDCEMVAGIARDRAEELRDAVGMHARGEYLEAARAMRELGLDEQSAKENGGGLIWLVVVAAAIALGSCEHCHASHPHHE